MTGVGNGDLRTVLSFCTGEIDTTAGWSELDGIRREIRKHLLQPNRVTNDRIVKSECWYLKAG
jgi:hypothetical protein